MKVVLQPVAAHYGCTVEHLAGTLARHMERQS
jgi:hypothetical protein